MTSKRKLLREKMNEGFGDMGIFAIRDKRRIITDALGFTPTLSAMKEGELQTVIDYIQSKTSKQLQSPVIAWAYMVELEAGFTKRQIRNLIETIPSDVEVMPFSLNETTLLEANSTVLGVIHGDFYEEYLEEIQQTLASVCNDWQNERDDQLYDLSDGYQVKMYCDVETVDSDDVEGDELEETYEITH